MPPHETGSTATPGAPRATAPPPRTFGPQGPTLGDLSDAYLQDYQVGSSGPTAPPAAAPPARPPGCRPASSTIAAAPPPVT